MEKLRVIKKEGANYWLIDEKENRYNLLIELVGINYELNVGDILCLNLSMDGLNMVSLGLLDNICGKKIRDSKDSDFVVLIAQKETIYLKKLYG